MRVAFLWHLHQPIYKKPGGRAYVLPWTGFHAAKNYHQMARLAAECGWPVTFNFVPCLLEQIEDYASGRAVDPFEAAFDKEPERLEEADLERLGIFVKEKAEPAALQRKALESYFSPVEKIPADNWEALFRIRELRRELLPLYKKLWEEGRVELTASAYHHPILPLLFDLADAGAERPPGVEFRRPLDGLYQLLKGRDLFTRVFGRSPAGLWPSECAVSRKTLRAAADCGYRFTVTDENILWKSLGRVGSPADLAVPYEGDGLTVFFRDRDLSDQIGFTYQHWNAKDAAADLVRRLDERRRGLGDEAFVILALDGENPWATYPDNGVPFLRRLYDGLRAAPGLEPAFIGDLCPPAGGGRPLEIVPGTWLGSFAKWAGSRAKNAGWETLARAREECGPVEALYTAEGSDWFWWFGEEPHPAFGELFRLYIEEGYRQAGLRP